jgi:hypothetical protein
MTDKSEDEQDEREVQEPEPKWTHPQMTPAPGPSAEPVRKAVRGANITPAATPALGSAVQRLVREITAKLRPR